MSRTDQPSRLHPLRQEPAHPAFCIESGLFTPSHDSSRVLFAPVHYEAKYGYPLVVWLHGPGADERQLLRVMPIISMRNYVAVSPRGLCVGARDSGEEMLGWPQATEQIQEAGQRVFDSIEAAQDKYHIASHRVFLAGFGDGGTMALRLALAYSRRFAGVISLAGRFPSGQTPLSGLAEARKLPIFLAVCRDSGEYPPAAACDDLRLFHTAGMSITLRQYPCAQQLSPLMLRDLDRWIIEQLTTAVAPQQQPSDQAL